MVEVFPSLIVGLGNPGLEYSNSRHNAGFMVIDSLIAKTKHKQDNYETESKSQIWKLRFKGRTIFLQKPMTFMNLSGEAVKKFSLKKHVETDKILIIYDDIDLPLGKLRLRRQGHSGGHNGISSVIEALNTSNINRLRIGIGIEQENQKIETTKHVLADFKESENSRIKTIINLATDIVISSILRGMDKTMNKYNGIDLID